MIEQGVIPPDSPPQATTRTVELGRTSYWNADPSKLAAPIIENRVPSVVELTGAIITPRDIDAKFSGRKEGRVRYATGGIYDSQLTLLPTYTERETAEASLQHSNRLRNDLLLSRDVLNDATPLRGSYVYFGILRSHFGHFLLESLSRAWFLLQSRPDVGLIVHGHDLSGKMPSYMKYVFGLLDIPLGRIVTASQPRIVEHLIVPEGEFEIRWRALSSYANTFRELHARSVRLTGRGPMPRDIYLTRRRLRVKTDRDRRKEVKNEDEIERLFEAKGFTVIAPETLPFQEQVALLGQAERIAGLKGSALHMSLFSQNPEARLMQIDKSQSMNQCLIDALKGMQTHHVFCQSRDSEGRMIADIEIVREALAAM